MAKRKKSAGTRKPWSKDDLKLLRTEAGATSVEKLARKLKRSRAAVQVKASTLQISMRAKKKKKVK